MDTSEAVKVKYDKDNYFEILVDPDLAKEVKLEGKDHDVQRMLFVQEVFVDAGKGDRASPDELEDEFNTRQVIEAAEKIFEEGEMQLTTEQKQEIREEKRKQIINMIARRAQNPQTGNPHPPERVENALEEAGFHVDEDIDVETQFKEAIDDIRPIIPVSLDKKTVAIKIPSEAAGKAYDKIQQKAEVKDEQWGNKYFYAKITVPAGILTELMEEVQKASDGEAQLEEQV